MFSWIFHLQSAMLLTLAIFFVYIAVFMDDMTPTVPLLLLAIFCINDPYAISDILIVSLAIPVGLSLIYHAIVYKHKKKLGSMFFPLALVSCCLLTGGIASPYLSYYTLGLPTALTVGLLLLFAYVYFYNYVKPPQDFKIKKYFVWILIVMALICGLQYLYGWAILGISRNYLLYFGWGNVNTIGAVFLISYPASFYLICKRKNLYYGIISLVILVLALLTTSDGARIILILMTPIALLYTAKQLGGVKKKITYGILLSGTIVLVGLIIFFSVTNSRLVGEKLENAFHMGDRITLYKNAIGLYVHSPIFGVGLSYPFGVGMLGDNFHSVFFHALATTGTFGILAYIPYYIFRIKTIVGDKKPFNFCMLFSFIALEIYAFIDTCEFNPFPIMITVTMLVLICDVTRKTPKKKLLRHKHRHSHHGRHPHSRQSESSHHGESSRHSR